MDPNNNENNGMDMKGMAEKIRKLEAELQQNKVAKSNEEGNGLKAENEGLKEKVRKLTKEKDKMKATADEEKAELEEQIAKKDGELKDLEEKVEKLGKEKGEMKKEISRMKTTADQEKAKLEKLKKEFGGKNAETEGKLLDLEEQKSDNEAVANLTERIEGLEIIQKKNNKWNAWDCGRKLDISGEGLVVMHSGYGRNCIRAVSPISSFNLNAEKPSIADYFEAQIVRVDADSFSIDIGFCTKQFPLENKWLGGVKNSIGIYGKNGVHIDGQYKNFENARGFFDAGDVIGLGIIHFPANSPMKCFATCNGQLLGSLELPAKFASLQLFPAVTLSILGISVRANFGQETWLFNPGQLLK